MTKEVLDSKCLNCGAVIVFDPTLGKWKCDYCGSTFTLEEINKYDDANNTEHNVNKNADTYDAYVNYHCESCGAEIIADENTAATFCVYCGNTAIIKNKLTGEFAPNKIIPFKKTKQLAIDSFKGLSKGRPLMPRTFNSEKNVEKITGVYIPFWLFNVNTSGNLKIEATRDQKWSVGNTHYTRTECYHLFRTCTMDFEKIPVDGSTKFDNDIMNTLEPFNYNEMVDYNHAYLAGFLAEKYDVPSENSFKEAGARALNSTEKKVLHDVRGYSTTRVIKNDLVAKQTKFEYSLFPVWMVNVKYNNKFYTFAMNGQTGEFVGNIPIDGKRALLYTVFIFILVFAIVIAISFGCHLFNNYFIG